MLDCDPRRVGWRRIDRLLEILVDLSMMKGNSRKSKAPKTWGTGGRQAPYVGRLAKRNVN